jgi:hypothetical protein
MILILFRRLECFHKKTTLRLRIGVLILKTQEKLSIKNLFIPMRFSKTEGTLALLEGKIKHWKNFILYVRIIMQKTNH